MEMPFDALRLIANYWNGRRLVLTCWRLVGSVDLNRHITVDVRKHYLMCEKRGVLPNGILHGRTSRSHDCNTRGCNVIASEHSYYDLGRLVKYETAYMKRGAEIPRNLWTSYKGCKYTAGNETLVASCEVIVNGWHYEWNNYGHVTTADSQCDLLYGHGVVKRGDTILAHDINHDGFESVILADKGSPGPHTMLLVSVVDWMVNQ